MPGPEQVFRFLRRTSIMSSGCRRLQALKVGPPVGIRGPWSKEVGHSERDRTMVLQMVCALRRSGTSKLVPLINCVKPAVALEA